MRKTRAITVAGVLLAASAGQGVGDEATAGRPAVQVLFTIWGTRTGLETLPLGAWSSGPMDEGASTDANMQARMDPQRDPAGNPTSPCGFGIGMDRNPDTAPQGPLPLWRVKAEVRHAEMDRIVVGYSWKRRVAAGRETMPDEGRGEATLKEGGRVLLDFLPVAEASGGCYHNVALELSASIVEDPALEDRRIGYDLWLVSEDRGARITRRLQLIGRQGRAVPFDYGNFRSKLSGIDLHHESGPKSDVMEMQVSGSVRGRLQTDGSIELRLFAQRSARPGDGRWSTIESGEKRVRAAAGETLRLELPPPGAWPGAKDQEAFQAIAGHRVALVLTPTPVE